MENLRTFFKLIIYILIQVYSIQANNGTDSGEVIQSECNLKLLEKLTSLETEMSHIKEMNENQQTEITSLQKELAGLQPKPTIAFLAELTTSLSGSSFRVYFQHVKLNVGNAYIPHHGLFIAPTNGTYLFSVSACSIAGRYITLSIVAMNNPVGHLLAGSSSITDCNSKDFVLWLQAGEDVFVRHIGEGDYLYAISQYGYPSFSGVLLHAD